MIVTRPDVIQRISFGKIITPRLTGHGDHEHGYVVGLGKRPKSAKGGLSLVKDVPLAEDMIYSQLENAAPALRRNSLALESPYADKGTHLASFAEELFRGLSPDDLTGMIKRIIDNRPYITPGAEIMHPRATTFEPPFRFSPDFLVPDAIASAGEILSEGKRVVFDEAVGGSFFSLAHVMEPYLISVAALRTRGINAYPANAVVPGQDGEIYHPLIVIADLARDVPLITFDMMSIHPPMGSVDIMSDLAVKAVTFTMLAEARIKHLTTRMALMSQDGKELGMDELNSRLGAIADALFECHKRWPGCHFISSALNYAVEDITSVLAAIHLSEIGANMEMAVNANPALARPGALEQRVQSFAIETATNFAGHIRHELSLKIAKSG